MLYNIIDFVIGRYEYDTLFIEYDKDSIMQIPIKKGICDSELIGEEIEIENLYTTIEKL